MASDIVPIQLSLTDGDLVTLWAPRWREDGEEWEAFLGDDDALFGFPEVAQLAAYVRTATEHDLIDHPAWNVVPDLTVAELTPDENHAYDIIGVPELAAEEPDTWVVGELAEIVGMVRSIAEVCDLDAVLAVLAATPAFALLEEGTLPFAGREGARLWTQLGEIVEESWDDVVDLLDALIVTPGVDAAALAVARREAEELAAQLSEETDGLTAADDSDDSELEIDPDDESLEAEAAELGVSSGPARFWEEVGIDPIRITIGHHEWVTLRCYIDDRPVFLGTKGQITVFTSERSLARWLADRAAFGRHDTDLAAASTWPEVLAAAAVGELHVVVDQLNAYVLTGLDEDIAEGPTAVDPAQLELATELLLDVGEWAEDDAPRQALAESESLGWLVSFIVRPNPTRLAPSPPFDAEAKRWKELVRTLESRLNPTS